MDMEYIGRRLKEMSEFDATLVDLEKTREVWNKAVARDHVDFEKMWREEHRDNHEAMQRRFDC